MKLAIPFFLAFGGVAAGLRFDWFKAADPTAPAFESGRTPQSEHYVPPVGPRLSIVDADLTAYESGAAISGRVDAPMIASEYEVEVATNAAFTGVTRTVRRTHPEFATEALPAAQYFVRARTYAPERSEPSAWSETTPVKITRHDRPTKPTVFGVPEHAFVGQIIPVNSESKTVAIRVTVKDDQDRTIYVSRSKEEVFRPPAAGRYTITAVAVNKDGFESVPSTTVEFDATEIPKAVVAPPAVAPRPLDDILTRAPAPLKANEKFRGDVVTIEGLLWRMQSSQQYYQAAQRPTTVGIGLRGLHWFGSAGIEGILRTDAFALNSAGGSSEIVNIEIHYHRRWFAQSPFDAARQMQMTIYAGVERFRNARSDLYSNGYDLLKIGATAHVPLFDRWSISGEGGFGFDTNGSRKYELQGLITYYYSREWSLGFGYRTNLFEAHTAAQAPGGFYPYREGYTEMRSVLNYQF